MRDIEIETNMCASEPAAMSELERSRYARQQGDLVAPKVAREIQRASKRRKCVIRAFLLGTLRGKFGQNTPRTLSEKGESIADSASSDPVSLEENREISQQR